MVTVRLWLPIATRMEWVFVSGNLGAPEAIYTTALRVPSTVQP
jgi:hypothetical protein